jgi:hypothetical protein
MDHSSAKAIVVPYGAELDLRISRMATKGFIASLVISIAAVVAIAQNRISARTLILLGGALLSPVANVGYMKLILRKAKTGLTNRSFGSVFVIFGGFVPYVFGCYLVLYESLWGFWRLLETFTFGSLVAAVIYLVSGYFIVLSVYELSEFGLALDEGRIAIKKRDVAI